MIVVIRRSLATAALCVSLALSGCAALSPERPEIAQQSAALANQQDQQARQSAAQASGRRVWLAGFAMNSTSKAFQGDLELVSSRLTSSLGTTVIRYEYSNELQTRKLRYPFAVPQTIREAVERIADKARPDDIVVLFISTHGSTKLLSVNAANKEYAPMSSAQLTQALAPLQDRPTVVILSACYSGSFIDDLRRDTRIVLTAAAGERSSYGCSFRSRNTFFIEELLAHNFDASMSLSQLMVQARTQIARREQAMKLLPSEPQVSVGSKLQWLADRPLKDWLAPE